MKNTVFLSLLMLLCTLRLGAQNYGKSILKGVIWDSEFLHDSYIFTDKYVYVRVLSDNWNYDFGIYRHRYYIGTKKDNKFDMERWKGSTDIGSYISIEEYQDILNPKITCYKILSCDKSRLMLYTGPYFKDKRDTVIWNRVSEEAYDTLRLGFAYRQLLQHRTAYNERKFFQAFPTKWYDFERTFRKAFFPGRQSYHGKSTDMSYAMDRCLALFSNLRNVSPKDYCDRVVALTVGMTFTDDSLSHRWNEVVTDAFRRKGAAMTDAVMKLDDTKRQRFWEYLCYTTASDRQPVLDSLLESMTLKDGEMMSLIKSRRTQFHPNAMVKVAPMPKIVKGIWHRTYAHGIAESERIYDIDTLSIVMKFGSKDDGTKLQYRNLDTDSLIKEGYRQIATSLETDTMLMAYADRKLREQECMERVLMERLFFESFPSTWAEFYAEMESTEVGNRNFRRNAIGYLDRFSELKAIPMADYIRKVVSVSIGAMSNSTVSEHWRQIVKRITEAHKAETEKVLEEYAPWQRLSFLEFVDNKGVQM